MEYVVSARVAQFDIQAFVNLEPQRKAAITPLLNMRGKDMVQLDKFAQQWGDYPYMYDVSRFAADAKSELITTLGLNDPAGHFAAKRALYDVMRGKNGAMIPVVGWRDGDPLRDIIQFTLGLAQSYEQVAIRINMHLKSAQSVLSALLAVVTNPKNLIVLFDYESIARGGMPDTSAQGLLASLMAECCAVGIERIVLMSSSYPIDKPTNGSVRWAPCHDVAWQLQMKVQNPELSLIFGDYGATDPNANVEYIVGMSVIPFANYYTPLEWWQKRLGGDKECERYVDMAKDIRALAGYHGDSFCWATKEIARIAATGDQYGNNGKWNGYKINQHICAQLDVLRATAYGVVEEEDEE